MAKISEELFVGIVLQGIETKVRLKKNKHFTKVVGINIDGLYILYILEDGYRCVFDIIMEIK